MKEGELFAKEELLLAAAEDLVRDLDDATPVSAQEFSQLLHAYKKIFKKFRSVIRTSDRLQTRMNRLNEALDQRNQFIQNLFGSYVSDEIVAEILQRPDGPSLGGETREVTILMADLRGFTAMCEELNAESVVTLLNYFLETMTEVILAHRGTINEIIGDSILVIFGAPLPLADMADRAVACALAMQRSMDRVNAFARSQQFPKLSMGIGINTGAIIVGNIGSRKRMKYGTVGSQVNLTARIEGYAVGGQIYISESTRQACKGELCVDNAVDVYPKGMAESIRIYDITGISGPFQINLQRHANKLRGLIKPHAVMVRLLAGKQNSRIHVRGSLLRYGHQQADLDCPVRLEQFSDICLSLGTSEQHASLPEVYGKIVGIYDNAPNRYRVHFTAITQVCEQFLESLTSNAPASVLPVST